MLSNKIVCYLFTAFDKREKLISFIRHYRKNKPGLNHKLVICYKLLDTKEIIKTRKYLKNINYIEFIDPIKKMIGILVVIKEYQNYSMIKKFYF